MKTIMEKGINGIVVKEIGYTIVTQSAQKPKAVLETEKPTGCNLNAKD